MRPILNLAQTPADVAVVLPTIVRTSLLKAARSVFTQNFAGRIHLLIGVDVCTGDPSVLDLLEKECPSHVMLTILEPGYSTSQRHGGIHSNAFGGSMRTVLSFLANSPLVAYLDDNDWWGANHLHMLKTVIAGKQWAWSGRWMVHPVTQTPICRDEWDSVGPGRGINAERFGGFVQPSGLMMDVEACKTLFPLWSMAAFSNGGGEDRLIFDQLNQNFSGAGTDHHTSFCTLTPDTLTHDHHKREFLARKLEWVYDPKIIEHIDDLQKRALSYFSNEDYDQSHHLMTQALSLNPNFAPAHHLNALIKNKYDDKAAAITALAQAIELDDAQIEWLKTLHQWLDQSHRTAEAERVKASIKRRFSTNIYLDHAQR